MEYSESAQGVRSRVVHLSHSEQTDVNQRSSRTECQSEDDVLKRMAVHLRGCRSEAKTSCDEISRHRRWNKTSVQFQSEMIDTATLSAMLDS